MKEIVNQIIIIAKITNNYDFAAKQITNLIEQEINSRINLLGHKQKRIERINKGSHLTLIKNDNPIIPDETA